MTDVRPAPADFEQRVSALDPIGSFLCEAPAGSGKTELLTQRVLTLLARVEKPEAVLAITFTRKAAAEMRDRLLHALAAGQGDAPDDPHRQVTWRLAQQVLKQDERQQWQLLQNPNRLQIRTFDGLCSHLTQSLPLQSALGVGVKVSDDAEALYRLAVGSLLDTLEETVPWADALARLLAHLDNQFGRLESLLVKMLGKRDVWMPVLGGSFDTQKVRLALELNLQHVLQDKVEQLHELIPDHLHSAMLELAQKAGRELQTMGVEDERTLLADALDLHTLPGCEEQELSCWRALAQLLLTKDGKWRTALDKRCGFPAGNNKEEKARCKEQKAKMQAVIAELADDPDLLQAFRDVATWPSTVYADGDWQMLQALTSLLPVVVAHLQLTFRAQGQVDFIEVSNRARYALGDAEAPTDLALRLDYQIQHILVDEFQDTSFTQYDLLQKLTAGWQPDDGRTLFCVGDAMQSIYGFRGANVGLFLHCKYHGLGQIPLRPLQLTTNFRSQAGVVAWVNETFAQAFPQHNDITTGAVCLARADAFKPTLDGAAVQTHIFDAEAGAEAEAAAVVDLITAAQAEDPENRIAILVRSRRHANGIVRALKRRRIAFRAVDLEALLDQRVIQDLTALTRALLFPSQRIAWLAVLRAPWCGLSLSDLEVVTRQLTGTEDEWVLAQAQAACKLSASVIAEDESLLLLEGALRPLTADGLARLQRVLPILSSATDNRQRKPLRQWVEGVWIRLGGPACLQAAHEKDNVQRFLNLLETFDERGHEPSLEELERELNRLFAAPDPTADDRLQIMTMHKCKGLEFDTVILPGLHRMPRNQEPELLLWQERLSRAGDDQLLLAPLSATGSDKNPIYKHLAQEKKKREQLETARLLYVACTRAKKRLHLLVQLNRDSEGCFAPPPAASLMSIIWPAVAADATAYSGMGTVTGEVVIEPVAPLQRLPSNWQSPELDRESMLDAFIPYHSFANPNQTLPTYDRAGVRARIGAAILQQTARILGQQGFHQWPADAQYFAPSWRLQLSTRGALTQELDDMIARLSLQINALMKDDKFRWLHNPSHQRVLQLPLSSGAAGNISHWVADILLQTADGETLLVGYSLTEPDVDQTSQELIESEKKKHRLLVGKSARALAGLGYAQVRPAVFFLDLCRWELC